MKPVKLKFKGINSFSEETEINFEKLIARGIFGIFGDTGSGKSTILDCINFALYGKIERSKEKLDIINYRCDSAEVRFEFDVLSEGKRRRYIAERSIKRKSGIHKAMLYEDNICIADNVSTVTKKITEVLGVDADDFRKCIALPQGEFSQFVKSQPSERIALIEHLFSLARYGDRLKERLRNRENQADLNFQTVNAKLGLYTDVSEEIISELDRRASQQREMSAEYEKQLKTAEKQLDGLNILNTSRVELDKCRMQLNGLENRRNEIDELRKGMKAVPVCKEVVEAHALLAQKENRISEAQAKFKTVCRDTEKINDTLKSIAVRAEYGYDEKIAECIAVASRYSAGEGKPEKLKELDTRLFAKRSEYNIKSKKSAQLRQVLSRAEQTVEKVKSKKSKGAVENLETILNVEFKGAVLKEEYVNTFDYLAGLKGQVNFHKDDSDLYNFMSRELKQQIDIYKEKVLLVKDFNLEEAGKKILNFQTASEEREKVSAELSEALLNLKDAQSAVEKCEAEIEVILRDGEELRKQADELRSELKNIFGDVTDYNSAKAENENRLAGLKAEKNKLTVDTDNANRELVRLKETKAVLQTELVAEQTAVEDLRKKLIALIEKSGFESYDDCKRLVDEFSSYADAEKAIADFDLQVASLSARIKELEKIKGIEEVSEEKLISAKRNKEEILSALSSAKESIAVCENERKKAVLRLKQKDELLRQLKDAEKERNLIYQLKELTKGNKFMEYIANEYLYDISSLASSTLLNLTDGRYFLTYTDNFYVGDNFNCGNLRGVNTLSGGETFLVSLSLALALSQTICSSLKSIEFFFLDEGFGTLDGTLVDTVMSALEKLKSSSFTIGIISHVEELKHRIDNKITVSKATESHGSSVRMSC